MLARYPELVPPPRPWSAAFTRAARSWWSGVRRPVLPTARRVAVRALAVLLLTVALSAVAPSALALGSGSPFPTAQVMAQPPRGCCCWR